MFRFFLCKSKRYASYMEIHLTITTNNILASAFENCEIYHILVLIFHGNNPKVKVHRGESPSMSN